MIRPTPETNALRCAIEAPEEWVMHAKQLERERDAAIKLSQEWEAEHDKLGGQLREELEACGLAQAKVLELRAQLEELKLTLEGIANAKWREWGDLASETEFVLWAHNRARHALAAIDAAKHSAPNQVVMGDVYQPGLIESVPIDPKYSQGAAIDAAKGVQA
jgi:hypothetical protein